MMQKPGVKAIVRKVETNAKKALKNFIGSKSKADVSYIAKQIANRILEAVKPRGFDFRLHLENIKTNSRAAVQDSYRRSSPGFRR